MKKSKTQELYQQRQAPADRWQAFLLFAVMLLLCISWQPAQAATKWNLSWLANPDHATLQGYKVYSAVGAVADVTKTTTPHYSGLALTVDFKFPEQLADFGLTGDDIGKQLCFRLTAYNADAESDLSVDGACAEITMDEFTPVKPGAAAIEKTVR